MFNLSFNRKLLNLFNAYAVWSCARFLCNHRSLYGNPRMAPTALGLCPTS